ncbi:phosphotransferase [Mycobacterium vicinigordonae]|uniref:Phosphotransferase n=1 Tax=Mycobacterium vicinigordonae TaxID=1719132 RepID=A0A7D6I608_9MYCO|nr:phosphotransferase [Mycobacterium vicinigordonae]QLL05417.1 phosphotransferase [Mycobacterium vicinigordonae]
MASETGEGTDRAIERPADLTAEWLTATLGAGAVAELTTERIGTGQMSECYRIGLTYSAGSGPASVVLKVAASDPVSRQTGLTLGLYEREVRFYQDIAPRLGGAVAPCYHAAIDTSSGVFDLLLADAWPATVGDEITGATTEQATLAVSELGHLHGPLLGEGALANLPWLNRDTPVNQAMISALYADFVNRYGDQIAPEHRDVCERLVDAFDGYQAQEAARGGPHGLMHGDFRLDNLLFGDPGADRKLTVVDWQTVSWGPAFADLAYFLGCAVPSEQRRATYDALLRAYHEALGPATPVTLDEVREGVRRQSFFGVMMAIVSSMLVERTQRGDQLFMTMLQRHCAHVLDTDALATLPAAAVPEPLRPAADDESAHTATDEALWSESWYADFVDAAAGVSGWFRLGRISNEQTALIHAVVCGPSLATVALDCKVPLPHDPWTVDADGIQLAHHAGEPLQTYRLDLRGQGQAFSDPSALLRGEPGEPVAVAMNLVWSSDGTPYKYRLTTRYEIPCTVSGTVTVEQSSYHLDSVPGQRDHSWGVRDWWSMDWMWCALHLDDGTHLHGLSLQIPNTPPISIGYTQDAAGDITELTRVNIRKVFNGNGLPEDTTLELAPGGMTAEVTVRAHAPVRLVAVDGRASQFPRAWVDVATTDGRTGVGWMEWNRSQSL